MKIKRFVAFYGYYLILLTVSCFIYGQDAVPEWKAGVAKTVITPVETVWMAGYAGRTKPAEDKIHDLWAKALYLEDAQGNQVLLITMDIESIPGEISGHIKERLKAETGMEKEQVVLNCSHTHSGPVLKSDYMYIYPLDDRQRALIDNYTGWFEDRIVQLGKEAARRSEPVKVSSQNGTVRFQVNRRNNKESELTSLTTLQGPNDYSVPVLKVEDETGRIKAIVFGYACHATVLNGYEWCGDYPGFAQIELEKLYPGATAMFFQGAGADQNPLPRRSIPLAKQYGKELAAAVERVIDEPMRELQPRLSMAYSEIQLDLGPIPTKKELKKYRKKLTGYEKKWAENTLAILKEGGSLPTSYPYPVQVWRLGNQTIVSLGGETLISYAIRLKELLGDDIFVMGYSNDVMAYIPSDEELLKGGYEIISSQRAFGLPASWKAGLEEKIIDEVVDLANQTSMQTTISGFSVKTDVAYQELSEDYCWFHPRATAIPGMGKNGNPTVIMTIQKELQGISDFYSGLYYMRTDDLGETWTQPIEIPELKWQNEPDGTIISVADVTPSWHAKTGKVLAVGIRVEYFPEGGQKEEKRSHDAAYCIYDPVNDTWTPWKLLPGIPEPDYFYFLNSGCIQWIEKTNGNILLPVGFNKPGIGDSFVTVFECSFDGNTLSYIRHGEELTVEGGRGLGEPSLAFFKGTYYLTLRNDAMGYVTTSKDCFHWEPVKPWVFDDGKNIGSYNTQTHWLVHSDAIFLTYTRKGANNDHIPRNRAPLFIAQVDPINLQVMRATEQVLIPERGVMLGNFGASAITQNESWVTDAEYMVGGKIHPRGANGTVWVARVFWSKDNKQ